MSAKTLALQRHQAVNHTSSDAKGIAEWQDVLDKDHAEIYQHAAARLAKIYAAKHHYIHQKAIRHQGRQTKQHKKQPAQQCHKPWQAPYHRWQPHRSGFQCTVCGERIHQALTVSNIEERLVQPCPQLTLEEKYPEHHSPHKPLPKKLTRAQVIANLLAQQKEQQQAEGTHTLEETEGYLRCAQCGISMHKRTNEAAFQAFVQGQCINQAYTQPHAGHASHNLWQRGEKLHCQNCGIQAPLDAQQRPIVTAALQKICKGATISGSPPLAEIFRRQTEKASQQSPEGNASTTHSATDTSMPRDKPPIGHDTQPIPEPLRTDGKSATTASPLAPRQLTYSEESSVPKEPGPSDHQPGSNILAEDTWQGLRRRQPFRPGSPMPQSSQANDDDMAIENLKPAQHQTLWKWTTSNLGYELQNTLTQRWPTAGMAKEPSNSPEKTL